MCFRKEKGLAGLLLILLIICRNSVFDSRVVSAVGEDVLGDEILENFNGRGYAIGWNEVSFPTGIVEVTLDGEGIPCYEIKQGVAWDNVPYTRNLIDWLVRFVVFVLVSGQRNVVTQCNVEPIFGGYVREGV